MSQSAETLTTIVRAMPPVVAGCRSSGGQNGGQESWAYESLSAAVVGVRQVSAKDALWKDSAPNFVLYVADDRCVIMQLYYLQSEAVVQGLWPAIL